MESTFMELAMSMYGIMASEPCSLWYKGNFAFDYLFPSVDTENTGDYGKK